MSLGGIKWYQILLVSRHARHRMWTTTPSASHASEAGRIPQPAGWKQGRTETARERLVARAAPSWGRFILFSLARLGVSSLYVQTRSDLHPKPYPQPITPAGGVEGRSDSRRRRIGLEAQEDENGQGRMAGK